MKYLFLSLFLLPTSAFAQDKTAEIDSALVAKCESIHEDNADVLAFCIEQDREAISEIDEISQSHGIPQEDFDALRVACALQWSDSDLTYAQKYKAMEEERYDVLDFDWDMVAFCLGKEIESYRAIH